MNLNDNLVRYLDGNHYLDGRKPDARYTSFDYCFNYFQSFREEDKVGFLADQVNIQLSCLHLGFYLASWGMLRGSSELLQKSARFLIPVIELIAGIDEAVWGIDAHCYTEDNILQLLETRQIFRQAHPSMSDILVTKIMLGVFGNVPAFDTNFKKGFQVSTFNLKALQKIDVFYKANDVVIQKYRIPTLDFVSGEPTLRKYTSAKVIDMAFFIEGMA